MEIKISGSKELLEMVKVLQALNVNLDAEFKEGRMEVILHGKKEKINESLEKLKKLQRGIKKGV
ncbi:MAG: hypothetical protein QXT22_01255 [Candidatus Hadarchaeales archaeon]